MHHLCRKYSRRSQRVADCPRTAQAADSALRRPGVDYCTRSGRHSRARGDEAGLERFHRLGRRRWLASGDVPASAYDPATTDVLDGWRRAPGRSLPGGALGIVDSIPLVPLPRDIMDPLTLGVYAAPHDRGVPALVAAHAPQATHQSPPSTACRSARSRSTCMSWCTRARRAIPRSGGRSSVVCSGRGIPRYGAINPLEQQADAASWALTTLILERNGEWRRHPISDLSQEMPGVKRMLGIFLQHPVFTTRSTASGAGGPIPLSGRAIPRSPCAFSARSTTTRGRAHSRCLACSRMIPAGGAGCRWLAGDRPAPTPPASRNE